LSGAGGTSGLVIGKFLPPHLGHLYLVREARRRVDRLHVVLFSKRHEPIPGALREQWLRELLPGVALHHVTEEHPVDFDDPAAWDAWVGLLQRTLPESPDLVFSSEPYGEELARRLGARHVRVDRARVPVSGTAVRSDPYAHWTLLPAPVRAYYRDRGLAAK